MDAYLGSKKLTAEESSLVDEIKGASLFSGWGQEAVLDSFLERKRKESEIALVERYADLVYQHIKSRIESNRGSLWSQLKEEGQCDVYDYLALFYNQTLLEKKRALAEIPYDEHDVHAPPSHVFDTTMGVKKWSEYEGEWYDVPHLYAIKMHRIFSNSDLLQRIALLFGPKFKAVRESSIIEEKEGQWGWKHTLVSIRVKYLGDQMGSHEVAAMLRTYAKQKARESFTLGENQWLYGEAFPERPVAKPAPPAPARVPDLTASSSAWDQQPFGWVTIPAHLSGTGKEEKTIAIRGY